MAPVLLTIAVLNHFLNTDIVAIRIFSRDEKIQDDMHHEFQFKCLRRGKSKLYIRKMDNLSVQMPYIVRLTHSRTPRWSLIPIIRNF